MKLSVLVRAAFAVAALSPVAAQAQLAQSHFNTGNDGWKLGDLFINDGFDGYVSWNSPGYISALDWFGNNGFVAPAEYLGDKSGAYGHNLTFSEYTYYDNAYLAAPLVVISDGTLRLQFEASTFAQQQWTNIVVPFTASAGWEVELDGSFHHQAPATEAQLQQVLGNLQYLHVLADFHEGSDLVYLDDVVMEGTTAPEPSSIVLLASGLIGIGAAARRRRSHP